MRFEVVRSAAATRDVTENAIWWADNRSREQSDRWLDLAVRTLDSLADDPTRHPLCDEDALLPGVTVRQINFGLGPRATHRVLFAVENDQVFVYRVLSGRRRPLVANDLLEWRPATRRKGR